MNKKKSIILGIMIVVVIIGITIISVNLFEKNKFDNSEERIQELYNYGNYIETKDVKPNTIVARFDEIWLKEEEILYLLG